jgi:hypothetical protein
MRYFVAGRQEHISIHRRLGSKRALFSPLFVFLSFAFPWATISRKRFREDAIYCILNKCSAVFTGYADDISNL